MDRLDEFAVLVAILDCGSLVGAARKLGRSAPVVTRTLASLEERVGATLVERSTRRVAPTEAGAALAEQARHLLGQYEDALQLRHRATLRGRVRVTAPATFGRRHVLPLVQRFLAEHDSARVELLLQDRALDLADDQIDVAVRIGDAPRHLVWKRLGSVRRVVAATPDYLARHGVPRKPADLKSHPVVFSMHGGAPQAWEFRGKPIDARPWLAVDDVESVLTLVRAGAAIGRFLSYQVADDLKAGRMKVLLRAYEPPLSPVQLLRDPSGPPRQLVDALLEHLARGLKRTGVLLEG